MGEVKKEFGFDRNSRARPPRETTQSKVLYDALPAMKASSALCHICLFQLLTSSFKALPFISSNPYKPLFKTSILPPHTHTNISQWLLLLSHYSSFTSSSYFYYLIPAYPWPLAASLPAHLAPSLDRSAQPRPKTTRP